MTKTSWSKPQRESTADLNRLNGMEDVLKCRRGRGRHARFVGVVNVVVAAVEEVQELDGDTQRAGDLVPGSRVE